MSLLDSADPERFSVSKPTLLMDAFMTQFIKIGGIGIILAVFGIFVFIVGEVTPLFSPAHVTEEKRISTGVANGLLIGADDWVEMPFVLTAEGKLTFVDLRNRADTPSSPVPLIDGNLKIPAGKTVTSVHYHPDTREIILGFNEGSFLIATVNYTSSLDSAGKREVSVRVDTGLSAILDESGGSVTSIDYLGVDKNALCAGIISSGDTVQKRVVAATFTRKKSVFGAGSWKVAKTFDITGQIQGNPQSVLINGRGDGIVVATQNGTLFFFSLRGDLVKLEQSFIPFEDEKDPSIASIHYLLGNESIVLTSASGVNRIVSAYTKADGKQVYSVTKKGFPDLESGSAYFAKSLRNRAFLVGTATEASLRYGTTESIRADIPLPFSPVSVAIGNRYDKLLFLSDSGELLIYGLEDHHPESGWSAFFGKIAYEGLSEPEYLYQSSAADESTEVKYSMIPLIFGSFKGTFYALIFAIPIALLSALYTSQFLKPELKKIVKPTMEIMASLPSVVLGFIGALWLAPRIEDRVPSLLLIMTFVPLTAATIGWLWSRLPRTMRMRLPNGHEFLILIPLLVIVVWTGWVLGPVLESLFFTVKDPATGEVIADFRLWWPSVTGTAFDQRNSLVLGFMMGFAVIPIIFTISEDAMSNVPGYLSSASLALGASRWQTAWRIVVPTASAGIFSALMIGLGRAVGETMIVVMCSGNTPVLEMNPFNGMRTLSANIAVELPEAAKGETHYRILYLGAMLLFIMTFIINTGAEIARDHLRKRFRTVG